MNLNDFMQSLILQTLLFPDLQQVKLAPDMTTHFWRYQTGKPSTYLATIEAIYYFCKTFDSVFNRSADAPDETKYDNLLFYFKYMYSKIRKVTNTEDKKLPKAYRNKIIS